MKDDTLYLFEQNVNRDQQFCRSDIILKCNMQILSDEIAFP